MDAQVCGGAAPGTAPDAGAGAAAAAAPTSSLQVGGPAVPLDHLGPIVINADGTTSRILGWAEKAPEEKELAMRMLAKRNAKRLAALSAGGQPIEAAGGQ